MKPVLEVKNVTKVFIGKENTGLYAVKDVSFQLYEGETLGIVGESGSGKSTIARLITGLLPITEGEILVYGKKVSASDFEEKKKLYQKVQMVFQNPAGSFDPRKTLGYGIGESLKNKGMKKEAVGRRTEELLHMCGLSAEFAKRYPGEVSGGECQRAAIARALAAEPSILICDEATSALDVTVQKQMLELLIKLKEEQGLSILFICHNLALVRQFCDRVVVLSEGKKEEEGTASEVIEHPVSGYTKTLLESGEFFSL